MKPLLNRAEEPIAQAQTHALHFFAFSHVGPLLPQQPGLEKNVKQFHALYTGYKQGDEKFAYNYLLACILEYEFSAAFLLLFKLKILL